MNRPIRPMHGQQYPPYPPAYPPAYPPQVPMKPVPPKMGPPPGYQKKGSCGCGRRDS